MKLEPEKQRAEQDQVVKGKKEKPKELTKRR